MAINILDEMKNNFLVYAQEVNQNRSFPDARDGLKPSQRAVLWEMYTKGYNSKKPHVKSAKVAGGTIASWWPHGDSSSYEALVRMSQPWLNNIPEIDFHGGNGSILGGPEAASSRYTECRLAKAVEDGFFTAIDKKVVDMIPNFSDDDEWPSVLPAIFPRLFVNGSQGIGYTIAQEWEPNNLSEFVDKVKEYIQTKKLTYDDIYPDYPTGGVIINKKDIPEIYKTGKGTIILRGKAEIIGRFINITELPYQVYAEPFIQKVKDLVNAGTISGIEDICNKSDDTGLLIEIECSADPNTILNKLYKLTELQSTFSANQMALVDGIPQILNLEDYIKLYIKHNIACIVRETNFDLAKAKDRIEIVQGLLKALGLIDKIIDTIKKSKDIESAQTGLIKNYTFTQRQAEAIVNMRLGKLVSLEKDSFVKEEAELTKIIDKCTKLLNSDKLQYKELLNRLTTFNNNYGWARHTAVIDADLTAEKEALKQSAESKVKVEENFIVILTKDNKIKRIQAAKFKESKLADDILSFVQATTNSRVILVSNTGKMYKLNTKKIDLCSLNSAGTDLKDLVGEKIISLYTGLEEQPYLFMITKQGLAKKIEASVVFNLSKCVGAPIMKVDQGDEIIECRLVKDDKITVHLGKKSKVLDTTKFLAKGRLAGGVRAFNPNQTLFFDFE